MHFLQTICSKCYVTRLISVLLCGFCFACGCVFAAEIGCDDVRALCGFFPGPDVAQSDMLLCADGNISPRETHIQTQTHPYLFSSVSG